MTAVTTMWAEHEVTLSWVEKDALPKNAVITTAHGFCFQDDGVILVNVDTRGWDFPGGHMEKGETPDECFLREVMEEACVTGDIILLGYVAVDNRNDVLWDASLYPAIGYQAYYRMDVTEVHPFTHEFEIAERLVVESSEISGMHQNWNQLYQDILGHAVIASLPADK